MIAYLKGKIQHINEEKATVLIDEAIGYEVWFRQNDLAALKKGQLTEIFCYHYITDRSQELYGFLSFEARDFFKLMIDKVAGVGPKSGLKILGKIKFDDLKQAIISADAAKLISLGLGRKTAEKIIVNLKDWLDDASAPFRPASPHHADALSALVSLGYSKIEAETALAQIDAEGKSMEELIREALKNI